MVRSSRMAAAYRRDAWAGPRLARWYFRTDARGSVLITKLNPFQLYPTVDTNVRAFSTTAHGAEQGFTLTLRNNEADHIEVEVNG